MALKFHLKKLHSYLVNVIIKTINFLLRLKLSEICFILGFFFIVFILMPTQIPDQTTIAERFKAVPIRAELADYYTQEISKYASTKQNTLDVSFIFAKLSNYKNQEQRASISLMIHTLFQESFLRAKVIAWLWIHLGPQWQDAFYYEEDHCPPEKLEEDRDFIWYVFNAF